MNVRRRASRAGALNQGIGTTAVRFLKRDDRQVTGISLRSDGYGGGSRSTGVSKTPQFEQQEESFIQRGIEAFKRGLFGVLFVMSKKGFSGNIAQVGFKMIKLLQLLSLAFSIDEETGFGWSSSIARTLSKGMRILAVETFLLRNSASEVYLLFFAAAMVWVCAVLVLAVWTGYSFMVQRFAALWPLKILRATAQLTATVLFIPLSSFLLGVMQCHREEINPFWVQVGLECWTGLHLFLTIVCASLTFVFAFFSGVVISVFVDRYVS